jgi:hypothetical protein
MCPEVSFDNLVFNIQKIFLTVTSQLVISDVITACFAEYCNHHQVFSLLNNISVACSPDLKIEITAVGDPAH